MLKHAEPSKRSRFLSWLLVVPAMLAIVPFELSARAQEIPQDAVLLLPEASDAPVRVAEAQAPAPASPVPAPTGAAQTPAESAAQQPALEPAPAETPSSPLTGGLSPEHRAELMRIVEQRLRLQQVEAGKSDPKTVAEFNALAEQANRMTAAMEIRRAREQASVPPQSLAQLRLQTLARELDSLRIQQERLLQQLRAITEQQRRITEAQMQLLREADQIREAPGR